MRTIKYYALKYLYYFNALIGIFGVYYYLGGLFHFWNINTTVLVILIGQMFYVTGYRNAKNETMETKLSRHEVEELNKKLTSLLIDDEFSGLIIQQTKK